MRSFLACALTVAVETPFLALFGYRTREDLTIIVCVNIVTNLLLNLTLFLSGSMDFALVFALEAVAAAAEYAVYARAFGHSGKLFLLTLAANCLSYTAGRLLL